MNFHVMKTSVVDEMVANGEWDERYTHFDMQKSDDGELIAIVGEQASAVKSFETSGELYQYCYSNGWTKSTEL